jgi:hypothetical protein
MIASILAEEEGAQYVVEKTPHHINYVQRIAEAYPEAKFIVMARDPYGFMLSYKHQGDRQVPKERKRFKKLYHPLGCALVYRGYARSIQCALSSHPDRVKLVRLRELKEDSEAVIRELERFLEVDTVAFTSPPKNSSFPGRTPPTLDPADIFWMNAVASRDLQALGYEVREGPRDYTDVGKSFLRIPAWGIRATATLWEQSRRPVHYITRWLLPGG